MPVTTPPSITALPAAPDPNDRATFNARAYPWSAALPTFATQVGALGTNVFDNATDAAANAAAASTARDEALQAQAAAEAASAAVQWVSGTTYAIGDVVWSPVDFASYRRKTAGAGTTDPSADATNWAPLASSGSGLTRSARTSNTILGASDKGKLIDITSGTFTQTFQAAATLADGWWCYMRNAGSGDITLDPNASETIDGLTSFVMYPGEVRLIQCDGTALRSVVLTAFYKTFTASGTFTKPPGYSVFEGLLWAGGGSGAKDATTVYGGSGGACAPITVSSATLGAATTVTIGAGGAATSAATGNVGGDSVFAGFTAYGGQGGNVSSGSCFGGSAFVFTVYEQSHVYGGSNAYSSTSHAYYGGGAGAINANRGVTVWGGGGGGGISGAVAQVIRGTTIFGGAGGASSYASNGAEGTAPGGGGGSTGTGASSGAGARGELRIWGVL